MTAPTYTKGSDIVGFLRYHNAFLLGDLKFGSDPVDVADLRAAINDACELIEPKYTSPHPLRAIYSLAIDQLTKGKGERHGGDATPFLQQPWLDLADTYGVGFLYGQSAKKAREAMGKEGEARERELLGALNYLAMGILYEQIRK